MGGIPKAGQDKTVSLILERQTKLLTAQLPTLELGGLAKSLKSELNTLATSKPVSTRTSRQAMIDDLWRSSWQPTDDVVQKGKPSVSSRQSASAVLDSLCYETLTHREEAIPQAHKSTFEWIFAKDASSRPAPGGEQWDSFPKWLTGTTRDSYWITGKPGSGKSTLMKFIAESDELSSNA